MNEKNTFNVTKISVWVLMHSTATPWQPLTTQSWTKAPHIKITVTKVNFQHNKWVMVNLCCPTPRCVENSSGETARVGRTTAATPTQWKPPWWTAVRTRSLFAWITSRAAAPVTNASTFTLRLTYRPG